MQSDPNLGEEELRRFRELTDPLSLREAAEAVGVSHGTIQRLRAGDWEYLHPKTRRKVLVFVKERAAAYNGREPEQESLNLLGADFDQLAKYIEGVPSTDPEEARLRKLDVLEGLRRVFSAYGPVPGAWYRLKEMVEKGEL